MSQNKQINDIHIYNNGVHLKSADVIPCSAGMRAKRTAQLEQLLLAVKSETTTSASVDKFIQSAY